LWIFFTGVEEMAEPDVTRADRRASIGGDADEKAMQGVNYGSASPMKNAAKRLSLEWAQGT
jgi:hypothetical protein